MNDERGSDRRDLHPRGSDLLVAILSLAVAIAGVAVSAVAIIVQVLLHVLG